MNDESNESGLSGPHRACANHGYEDAFEQMLFESETDENSYYEFTDSETDDGFDDMAENTAADGFYGSEGNNIMSCSTTADGVGETAVVRWREDDTDMPDFAFTGQNRLLVPMPGRGTPLDFFFLLFDDAFVQLLVDETNNFADEEFLRVCTAPRSRLSEWKNTDRNEMLTFIALIVHTGTIRVNRLSDYWKKHHLFDMSCFSSHMNGDRFLILMRCFHFAPNIGNHDSGQPLDRLHKVRPLIHFFNNKMNSTYYPQKELSLDESMVLWKGRLQFRNQIQNKRHKYGLKLYMLTEPDGMVLKFAMYTGILDDMDGKGHAANVVLNLMSEHLNNGHALYMVSCYNSFDLATKLIENNTYCTGALIINKKNTPKEVTKAKLKKNETISRYSRGVLIGKWKDKTEVTYISTEFKNNLVVSTDRKGNEKIKPDPIVQYNKFMSGTDRQDQMQSYYPFTRKTIRWYKQIGIHVIQMLFMNSFHLYNKNPIVSKMSLYDFRLSVLSELLPPKPKSKCSPPKDGHFPTKYGSGKNGKVPRRRCQLCYKNGKIRKDTSYYCTDCPKQPSLCLDPCFKNFHTKVQ